MFKNNRPSGQKILFRAAMIFSWFTTGYAAITILPDHMDQNMKYLMAFGVSTLLQTVIGLAWPECFKLARRACFGAAFVVGAFALAGSATSGLLASSTNTLVWRTVQIETAIGEDTVTRALSPVEDAARKAETVARLLSDYAAFALEESELEARSGTSCDFLDTGDSCGPLCRLRRSQSQDATERKESTRDLLERVDGLRSSAGGNVSQDRINDLFRQANALSRDELFAETSRWAARERAAFAGGGHDFEGGTLQCLDADAVARLDQITAALPTGGNSVLIPPTVVDPGIGYVATENADAMRIVWQKVVEEGQGPLQALTNPPASLFVPFWGFSLLIELICVVLGVRLSLDGRPIVETRRDNVAPSLKQINRAEAVAEVLDNLVIRNGRHTYFLLPVGGKRSRMNRNARIISRLPRLIGLRRFVVRSAIPLEELAPAEAERIRKATGADHVEVFRVRNLRKLETRIADVIGLDDRPLSNVVAMNAHT